MAQAPFDPAQTRLTLFDALLRARAAKGGRAPIAEDQDRKVLTYDDIVRAAFALGGRLKARTRPKERVGVLLPTGLGALVTFFALHAIGRTPAMLNFTAGARSLKSGCGAAGITRILTARRFVEIGKLHHLIGEIEAFAQVIYLEDVRAEIGLGDKIAALIKGIFPRRFSAGGDPDDAGVVLFTSGSFGAPRGVVLSHANLVANVAQCYAHIAFEPDWRFFNPLPMFHCFGLTGGALLPVLTGHKTFLYPSPLHIKEIPPLIRETGANVLLGTDTFAAQWARNAKQGELSCLKFVVLGAERVKEETRALYQDKFGVELLEGYGATEASPVIAVNQPGANRAGTVGRLLPGVEWKLEPAPGISQGARLVVSGPNVMRGYVSDTGALEPPPAGWHDTGDIVRIDADGFCTIIGRLKRFAKIGGETVSLSAVESYAASAWPDHIHAAVALPDARKGERIVLFSDKADASPSELLAWAHRHGAPEIAVPKKIVALAAIPVLGTGKIDYAALQRQAEEGAGAAEAA